MKYAPTEVLDQHGNAPSLIRDYSINPVKDFGVIGSHLKSKTRSELTEQNVLLFCVFPLALKVVQSIVAKRKNLATKITVY